MPATWTEAEARDLEAALAPHAGEDGALGYCEAAGFLFAVACSPELVKPSEWIPMVLGEDGPGFADLAEARRTMDLVMRLYNHVNDGVFERAPRLPAGIEADADPMKNFGPEGTLGRWATGYAYGQSWLEETWDEYVPSAPESDSDSLDKDLGGLMLILSYFASREAGMEFHAEGDRRDSFEDFSAFVLENFHPALTGFAELSRDIEEAVRKARTPARGAKVGRNAPCPCGSGKKYKLCCGRSAA